MDTQTLQYVKPRLQIEVPFGRPLSEHKQLIIHLVLTVDMKDEGVFNGGIIEKWVIHSTK